MIKVSGANSVTMLLSASSSFVSYKDVSGDPSQINSRILSAALDRTYAEMLSDHVKDFSALFNRVSLQLGEPYKEVLTTDRRFELFQSGKRYRFCKPVLSVRTLPDDQLLKSRGAAGKPAGSLEPGYEPCLEQWLYHEY